MAQSVYSGRKKEEENSKKTTQSIDKKNSFSISVHLVLPIFTSSRARDPYARRTGLKKKKPLGYTSRRLSRDDNNYQCFPLDLRRDF